MPTVTTNASANGKCPLSQQQLIDKFFVEYRTKVLDVAAYLDRLDRAERNATDDFRLQALAQALRILAADSGGKTTRILMALSDPTIVPLDVLDRKSAYGAYQSLPDEETVV